MATPRDRDDVAEVRDGRRAECTLGALQEELVSLQLREHGTDVAQVVRLSATVNQNIVKEHKDKAAKKGLEDVVHQCLERGGGVA
jgi:hypothetical protein